MGHGPAITLKSVNPARVPLAKSPETAGRWTIHELGLICVGFVLPLGSDTQPHFLSAPSTKLFALTVATIAIVLVVLRSHPDLSRLPQTVRRSLIPLAVFAALLVFASATRSLPKERYQLLGAFLLTLVGFLVVEATRPGGFLDVVYRVALLHLAFAIFSGQTEVIGTGNERLAGATSALLIGFEASLIVAISYSRIISKSGNFYFSAAFLVLGVYGVYAAFSRAAIIFFVIGVLYLLAFRKPYLRSLKISLITVLIVSSYLLIQPWIVSFLGGDDPESLETASGRYSIWDTLLLVNDSWWRGWGYAAMRTGDGPDAHLYLATMGLPPENALLQVVLMGGVVAGAVWIWLAVQLMIELWCTRDQIGATSVLIAIILAGNMAFSAGLSGVSYDFWWFLGALSFAGQAHQSVGARKVEGARELEVMARRKSTINTARASARLWT